MKIRVLVKAAGASENVAETQEEVRVPSTLSLLQPPKPVGMAEALPRTPASHDALKAAARLRLALGPSGSLVAVTGIGDDDGSTLLTARLGAALAALDNSMVLLVDGAGHRPGLPGVFSTPRIPGLLDLLEGRADLKLAVRALDPPNLFVLPVGEGSRSLASLLTSPKCLEIMSQIRQQYRYVITDVGVMHEGADGVLLASMCDGVVAALAAGARRRWEVVDFRQELERMKIPLLGVVLTKGAS